MDKNKWKCINQYLKRNVFTYLYMHVYTYMPVCIDKDIKKIAAIYLKMLAIFTSE